MALTTVETQITWSAADAITLNNAAQIDSDVFTLDESAIAASIQVYVANQGAPANGDTLVSRIKWSTGDILGNTGNDFDTDQHAQFLGLLDTFNNQPGENPASRTWHLTLGGARKLKLSVLGEQAASHNLVVHARIVEHRAA